MSENWNDDYEDENEVQPKKKSGIRQHVDTLEREKKELQEKLDSMLRENRSRAIEDAVKDSGFDPKIASLIPSSVEGTKDAVKSWLDEHSVLFASAKQEVPAPERSEQDELMAEYEGQMSRMDNAFSHLVAGTPTADEYAALMQCKDVNELNEFIHRHSRRQ